MNETSRGMMPPVVNNVTQVKKFVSTCVVSKTATGAIGAMTCGIAVAFFNICLATMTQRLNDTILAGLMIYFGGLTLSLLLLPSPIAKLYCPLQTKRREFKWWMICGGLLGGLKTILGSLSVSKLHATLVIHSLGFNLGQIACGSITDHFGFLGSPKKPVNVLKGVSLLFFTTGMLLFSVQDGQLQPSPFILVAFATGATQPLQICVNKVASDAFPYKLQANALNYLCGFVSLTMIWIPTFLARDEERTMTPVEWYLYIVPVLIAFSLVFSFYYFAPMIGMALFSMILIVAEISTATILSSIGSFSEVQHFTWWMAGGLLAASVGAVLSATSQCGLQPSGRDDSSRDKESVVCFTDIEAKVGDAA